MFETLAFFNKIMLFDCFKMAPCLLHAGIRGPLAPHLRLLAFYVCLPANMKVY
jgi:hypothetical protein